MAITAGQVMDRTAALMNDTLRTVYTYTKQIPYLNTAYTELGDRLELNNVPVTNATSAVIDLDADTNNIGLDGPALPVGLVDIQQLWQRQQSTNDVWTPIQRYEFLPHYNQGQDQQYSFIPAWAWIEEVIKFVPANANLEVKVDYIKDIFDPLLNENSIITVINSFNFLSFKNAALCSMFIGENETRAQALNAEAELAWDRLLGTSTKGRQSIATRRRPFQAKYKRLRSVY